MMFVSAVIALFFVTFISFPISCEGLKCYECSAWNEQSCTATASNCPMCMVFRNEDTPDKFDRRCCWWGCGAPNQISEHAGRPTYFCDTDECNGLGSEEIFLSANSSVSKTTSTSSTMIMTTTTTATSTTTVTTEQSSSQCFDCSGSDCGKEGSSMSMHCPKCMVYRNPDDETKIERRCCWWGCGPSNAVSTYNGIETYFCTGHKCNGYGAEYALGVPKTTTPSITTMTTTSITTTTITTTVTTEQSSSQCFDCSGSDCGKEGSSMSMNCPKCMVYRNPDDETKIERRCCWWSCGPSNAVSTYNGIETYFCTGHKCNGYGAESSLSPAVITTTKATVPMTTVTTVTTATTMMTTITTTAQTSFQCYDCSGADCGRDGSMIYMNCPRCMVYRNPSDQTKIERRCCRWSCGPSNSVSRYNGIETFFCSSDRCNGYGAEFTLSPAVTTTTTTPTTRAPSITTTPMSTTITTTMTTTITTEQSSSQCFDCSGSDCGKEGSSMSMNCPKCMVYRNPDDQTIIERRCCWWGCGPSNAVSTYNGIETYFCTGHKCNGYAAESVLSPPVTTTTVSTRPTTTTSTFSTMASLTTTVTSSSGSCSLNCRNGGTPETEDGCFCYCLENTYGRECENVDCAQPDIDPEVCSLENQSLCQESETFAFECLHRCGKC